MAKQVTLNVRNVYGNELIYPHNDTAKLLLKLTGKRTFSKQDISNIYKLGYSIEFVAQEVVLI